MAQTQVILLERIESLGQMGDVVKVKPGFARNYLLPQKKALRANKQNVAYFEAQKKHLEVENEKGKKEAAKLFAKLEGLKVSLIRQAAESGQLYGSVNSRDIAEQISKESGLKIDRSMVLINQNYKTIGLFPIPVRLHPEVSTDVTINIARSPEEAEIQATTGRALVADARAEEAAAQQAAAEDQLKDALEEDALEAEVSKKSKEAAEEASEAEEKKAKSEARAAKKAAKAADEGTQAEASDEAPINEPED